MLNDIVLLHRIESNHLIETKDLDSSDQSSKMEGIIHRAFFLLLLLSFHLRFGRVGSGLLWLLG